MKNYIENVIRRQSTRHSDDESVQYINAIADDAIIGESIAPEPDDSFTFDRFIDEIVMTESKRIQRRTDEDTPQRRHAKRYYESWLNSTRIGG